MVATDLQVETLTPLNRKSALFVDPVITFRRHACPSCGQASDGYILREGDPSTRDLSVSNRAA